MNQYFLKVALSVALNFSLVQSVSAAEATVSATGSMFKMLIGLAVVLFVLAIITWAMKKWLPNVSNQPSVIRVIGGASVGSRERVVVLEVANRWIVVGVAGGQVTSLANLEPGSAVNINASAHLTTENSLENTAEKFNLTAGVSNGFATWLKASTAKILDKKST